MHNPNAPKNPNLVAAVLRDVGMKELVVDTCEKEEGGARRRTTGLRKPPEPREKEGKEGRGRGEEE